MKTTGLDHSEMCDNMASFLMTQSVTSLFGSQAGENVRCFESGTIWIKGIIEIPAVSWYYTESKVNYFKES